MPPTDVTVSRWFAEHRAFIWGLSYRITGSAADADDVVQDTFMRAYQHAPAQLDDPRRWLTRVAVNAGRDVLRRRKRRGYVGPWLPTPVETIGDDAVASFEPTVKSQTLEGRYDLMESASLAFLQSMEALTPTQRAVLLLRDVFDYSAGEVASALGISEGNVRVTHHRARRAMEAYDQHRTVPTSANRARTDETLGRFLSLLQAGDVPGIERMLAAGVKAIADGGGEFTALLTPMKGAHSVARFFARLAASRANHAGVVVRTFNGFPAALLEFGPAAGRRPPRVVLSIDVDPTGLITSIRAIASTGKLSMIRRIGDWVPQPMLVGTADGPGDLFAARRANRADGAQGPAAVAPRVTRRATRVCYRGLHGGSELTRFCGGERRNQRTRRIEKP